MVVGDEQPVVPALCRVARYEKARLCTWCGNDGGFNHVRDGPAKECTYVYIQLSNPQPHKVVLGFQNFVFWALLSW